MLVFSQGGLGAAGFLSGGSGGLLVFYQEDLGAAGLLSGVASCKQLAFRGEWLALSGRRALSASDMVLVGTDILC